MKPFIHWTLEHPLLEQIAFWLVYLGLFRLAEVLITEPVWIVHCFLDDLIPFWKYALPGYCLWFAAIVYTIIRFLFAGCRKDYLHFILALQSSSLAVLLFYFLVPNGLALRPAAVEGNDLFAITIRALWAVDSPCNVCPSLHVLIALIIDLSWQDSSFLQDRPGTRVLVHVLDACIIASTVLLKQHSVIDVLAALVWGFFVYARTGVTVSHITSEDLTQKVWQKPLPGRKNA